MAEFKLYCFPQSGNAYKAGLCLGLPFLAYGALPLGLGTGCRMLSRAQDCGAKRHGEALNGIGVCRVQILEQHLCLDLNVFH